MIAKGYDPKLYQGYKSTVKVTLPYAHMVLVHDECGGQVDPVRMAWDGYRESVYEYQYCNGCGCNVGWNQHLTVKPRRAWKRALVLDAPLTDSDWPAQEYEE